MTTQTVPGSITPLEQISVDDIKNTVRAIPDFPKPGILFKDITTLLKHPAAFKQAIDQLDAPIDERLFRRGNQPLGIKTKELPQPVAGKAHPDHPRQFGTLRLFRRSTWRISHRKFCPDSEASVPASHGRLPGPQLKTLW